MNSYNFLVITLLFCLKEIAADTPQQSCKKNHEEYLDCGSACPITCDNHLNPPISCSRFCIPDCFCKTGYVRNRSGNCVLPRDCPQVPQCSANEVYDKCGTACPITCINHLKPPSACTLHCVIGCKCKKEYVRNNFSGKCVLPSECPLIFTRR